MKYIDSHAHLYLSAFEDDLEAVVSRAKEAGVDKVLLPNIDCSTLSDLLACHKKYPDYFYPMLGLHPTSVKENYREELDQLKKEWSINNVEFVAIGEVGLDFYWDIEYKEQQIVAFKEQLDWSLEMNLPVVVHAREAYVELEEILKLDKYKDCTGVIHSFTGTSEDVDRFLPLERWRFGVNGIVTFKNSNLNNIIKKIPIDRLLIETDSPYLAPVPKRGKRNESSFLYHVLVEVANSYGLPVEKVAKKTFNNTFNLFKALKC